MEKSCDNNNVFDIIRGSTIGLIYIFEGEQAPGFKHYDIWKSDVIAGWMSAVQELNCMPFIIDVRTFIEKSMNNSLPKLDYIINLNAGAAELSALGLVPTISSFLNIPCIPCDTLTNLLAEHKGLANHIAKSLGITIPNMLDINQPDGIFRPINFGSSRGVRLGYPDKPQKDGLYQKFVPGYDITTPIMYNPLSGRIEILPTVMYSPPDKDIDWIFDENVKEKRGGYFKQILQLSQKTEQQYLKLAKTIGIFSYCRIDARIHCETENEWDSLVSVPIEYEKVFFLEINATPTIKPNINFLNSIESLEEGQSFHPAYKLYQLSLDNATPTGFVLACSLLAAKARHYEKTD